METIERVPRSDKVAIVADVESRLNESAAALLTEYRGISVANLERLRRSLREAGGDYKIYKNTLVRRAVKSAGFEELEMLLTGPTGIAFVSGDVSAVAKVLRDFARENPSLVVKGGLVGRDLINAGEAAALAELPSRDVLLAQVAGMLAAPMQRFASLLQAVPQKFAYAISALIESRPVEAAPVSKIAPVKEADLAVHEGSVEDVAPRAADSSEVEVVEAESVERSAPESDEESPSSEIAGD
ncbi:MAG TPA: 50S ribosomal protein L10 [Acidimicrobiales bacterium]|nr:50S ribosomal protein L10 [Acidimicrobiales bacterium]